MNAFAAEIVRQIRARRNVLYLEFLMELPVLSDPVRARLWKNALRISGLEFSAKAGEAGLAQILESVLEAQSLEACRDRAKVLLAGVKAGTDLVEEIFGEAFRGLADDVPPTLHGLADETPPAEATP